MTQEDNTRYCIQCNQAFSVSNKEVKRCESNGFDLPLRCPECRKHKTKNADPPKWTPRKGRPRKGWDLEEEY